MDSLPTHRPEDSRPDRAQSRPVSGRALQAETEIGHTDVGSWMVWALIGIFLGTIFGVPIVDVAHELRTGDASSVFVRSGSTAPRADPSAASLPRRIVRWNRILLHSLEDFETRLEDGSLVAGAVRPWVQYLLAAWLGGGNEEVYPGRTGWLFHRPAVDYVAGPGFLEPDELARRLASGKARASPPQPDPREAILDFRDQLADRGIQLVVVPAPVKPVVHPGRFSSRYGPDDAPVQNASFERFRAELEAEGVPVFDPAPVLAEERRRTGRAQYLRTDTHWRPEAVGRVAEALGAFLEKHVRLPDPPSRAYVARAAEVTGRGDLARMLDLPETQRRFPSETVTVRRVTGPGGTAWQPDRGADVLVLGDSFTNIYSVEELGWGTAGGLAEHLSLALDRPVDRIARNDDGAFATREILAREVAREGDRLAGKRVVVWEFAARELTVGDWKEIDLAAQRRATDTGRFLVPQRGAEWVVEARLESVASVPRPGTVPYDDQIVAAHLADVRGGPAEVEGTEAVVYTWGMRDGVRKEAAHWRPGERLRLRIRPWSDVAPDLEGLNRGELGDPELQLVRPWWVEEVLQ